MKIHWEDSFSTAEQEKLRRWISEVNASVEHLVGPFPFDVHITFARYRGAGEPVPWAHTQRGSKQGVRFVVDTSFPLETFRQDWTAPHELSHLILPYLGRKHSWFSEGFASYMQYQVMYAMGVLSAEEVAARYRVRLDKAARNYGYADRSFVDAAPRLRADGKYPVMYWGGAVFFMHLNQQLTLNADTTLIDVLSHYLACCRRNQDKLERLIAALDEVLGSQACADELELFREVPGFPTYRHIELGVSGAAAGS